MDVIEDSPLRFVLKLTKGTFSIEYKRTDFHPQPRKFNSFPFLPEKKKNPSPAPSLLPLAFPNIRTLFNPPPPLLVQYLFPHPYRYPPAVSVRPKVIGSHPGPKPPLRVPTPPRRLPESDSPPMHSKAPIPIPNPLPPGTKAPSGDVRNKIRNVKTTTPLPNVAPTGDLRGSIRSAKALPILPPSAPPCPKAQPTDLRVKLSVAKAPPPRPPPPPVPIRRRSRSPLRAAAGPRFPSPRALAPTVRERHVERPQNIETRRIVGLLSNVEEKEFVRVLSEIVTDYRDESQRIRRFMAILRLFKVKNKKRQYALGRAMLAVLASEEREFVLQIVGENIFDCSRLNTLCRLKYFSVEVTVLLDNLLRKQREYDHLQVAVLEFQRSDIVDLIKFITLHSPAEIVEKMSRDDVFRGDLVVVNPEELLSESRKRDFIAFVCEKLEIDVPFVS